MSRAQYPLAHTEAEARQHVVKFVGGTTAVTKVFGAGMTVTYMSTGVVKISWTDTAENPGKFVGVQGYCFSATTPGNVKGFVLVHEDYVPSTRSVLLDLYSGGTLTDLAAAQWLTVTLLFKETSIS